MKRITLSLLFATIVLAVSCDGLKGDNTADSQNPGNPQSGSSYQPSVSFTFGAVDLGLSVKWANANVGAASETEAGNYYAWGEVVTKTEYSWNTYKWCEGSYDKLTKYSNTYGYGQRDNNKVLDNGDDAGDTTVDDVARVVLQGKWRMPTSEEMDELLNNCQWIQKDNGYIVKSKTNGNFIFLPKAGYMSETNYLEGDGFYWTASIHSTGMPFYAVYLGFGKVTGAPTLDSTARTFGASVRGVLAD